ncbi:MAG TPA: NUDIX domain-containing protein [Limnochordia bacterium]|nr:NUDIX domain-containing protein [Limnochordia bacterium]
MKGRTISREAVRAIVLEGEQVLMVYSPVNQDYKFPGGGIKGGESHEEALHREIKEECGVHLSEVKAEFGFVEEYSSAREAEYDVFRQISYYYLCKVNRCFVGQSLDSYERELGFRPEWVSVDYALRENRSVLNGDFDEVPKWTLRDTWVLNQIATERGLGRMEDLYLEHR